MRLLVILLLFFSAVACAHHRSKIDTYIKKVNPNVNIGVEVKSLKTGRVLYQRNAKRLFVPGSNMKVLTAEAGLLLLGSQYEYRTRLYSSAKRVVNGVLKGNLYLDFSGDPTFTVNDYNGLLAQLRKRGVRRIDGNIYVDDYGYDENNRAKGWSQDDYRFCYSAPISSIILSHNCMPFVIYPSKYANRRARLRPANNYYGFLKFRNLTRSKDSTRRCPLQMSIDPDNAIVLSGCVKRRGKPVGRSAAVDTVWSYNKSAITYLLGRNGVTLNGKIIRGRFDRNARLIAYHNSDPLYKIVKTMLKKSDNIMAESLFKKIGQAYYKQAGSWKNGEMAVKAILKKEDQINLDNIVIEDGSGLSHYDLVSPNDLVEVLYHAYRNFPTNKHFYNALPISATDGTLKYRMKSIKGRVHAKTGTLSGVSALSGYVKTRHNGTYVFSIMINGFSGSQYPYRRLEDRIVTYLAKQ